MWKRICLQSVTCHSENGKYLASIMNDSAIICDEVIESFDEEINFNEKKAICKTDNFYILLDFLLVTIALLTAISICYYLIIYQGKHLLAFYNTNNKPSKIYIRIINWKWVI